MPQRVDNGMHSMTLTFLDSGLEAGFAKERSPKLIRNLALCGLASGGSFGVSVVLQSPWSLASDMYLREQERDILFISGVVMAAGVLFAAIVSFVCFLPSTTRMARPIVVEFAAVLITCVGMILAVASLPFYVGRLMGHNPEAYLEAKHITDTGLLLSVDAFITCSHVILPIRFRFMLPVQVCGLLCYALPVFVLGSSESENFANYFAILFSLVVLSAVGKHAQERKEREQFANVIHEKSLRFQSEFQLSQVMQADKPRAIDRAPSESGCETIVSTTPSERALMPTQSRISGGFFQQVAEIGQKEHWLIQKSELSTDPDRVLVEGGFGKVLMGEYQGVPAAIKVPKMTGQSVSSESHLAALCNELRILRRLRHPNIVFLYGACLDEGGQYLALVLELVSGMTLGKYIVPARGAPRPRDRERSQLLVDVSCALRYLHTRTPHVVHGDMKASNVFVEPSLGRDGEFPRAKLLDFGLSRMLTKNAAPMGGTVSWVAPEIVSGQAAVRGMATDAFSFGRLSFFVVSGKYPFHDKTKQEVLTILRSTEGLPPLEWRGTGWLEGRWRELADACCSADPARRPSMQRVFESARAWHRELLGSGSADPSTSVNVAKLPTLSSSSGGSTGARGERRHPPALQAIDEEAAVRPGPGALPQPREQQSSRLLAPAFAPTAPSTVEAMIVEIMISCNLLTPADACCSFHGAVQEIGRAAGQIAGRGCRSLFADDRTVRCQCRHCGVLSRSQSSGAPSSAEGGRHRDSSSSTLSSHDADCFFCGKLMVDEGSAARVGI